ncbi:hypothetical protein HJFPF1_08370 [Paramyrothecium foliicola]|nr:hypothetical protein HJFPF1_08370 [Paramyrothecium foliicola]
MGEGARDAIFMYRQFNLDALLNLAGGLRQRTCSCDRTKRPVSGSLNWVVELIFDDGVTWIFRSPLPGSMGTEFAGLLLASEVATMKYVREHTSIPIPEIFHHSHLSTNEIGVPYILMSKAHGKCLSSYDWLSFKLEMPLKRSNPRRLLTAEERQKIMFQLGSFAAMLSTHRFEKIGSLFEDENGYTIKQCLSPSHTCYDRDTLTIDRGPFDKESDYFLSLIEAHTMHAKKLPLDTHCFSAPLPIPDDYLTWSDYKISSDRWNDFMTVGDKISSSKNRLDYCAASQLAKEMIPSLTSGTYPSGFPLRHFDTSINNIFVDDDMNITSMIDWAFASAVPFTEILATPGMPHSRETPEEFLVASYQSGFAQHSKQGISCEDTGNLWHFQRFLSMDSAQDFTHFQALYSLAAKMEPSHFLPLLKSVQTDLSEGLTGLDTQIASSNSREHEYFSNKSATDREAVARKLTVMMELNPLFVADRILWQWVIEATSLIPRV